MQLLEPQVVLDDNLLCITKSSAHAVLILKLIFNFSLMRQAGNFMSRQLEGLIDNLPTDLYKSELFGLLYSLTQA